MFTKRSERQWLSLVLDYEKQSDKITIFWSGTKTPIVCKSHQSDRTPKVKSRPTRLHACSFWRWYPLLCRISPSSDWYLEKALFTLDIRECAADLWHTSGEDISYCAICLFPSPCTWQVDKLTISNISEYRQSQKIRIQNIKHGQTERKIFLPTFPSTRSVWKIYRTFYLARTCFQ